VLAAPLDPTPPKGESPEVHWFDFAAAQDRCESTLAPALAKLGDWYASVGVKDLPS
jgi:hypothetical protein